MQYAYSRVYVERAITNPDRTVSIRDFRENLPSYLREVRQGASLTVTSRGQVVARVTPPVPANGRRRPIGLLRGRIVMAEDFDATPAGLIAAMQGGDPVAGG